MRHPSNRGKGQDETDLGPPLRLFIEPRREPNAIYCSRGGCIISIKLPTGNRESSDAYAREPRAWWQRHPLGPLFGGRARDWAETWEGPRGWGTPVYEHVLDPSLHCGCGAGRFARMPADRGASVAGIDAA